MQHQQIKIVEGVVQFFQASKGRFLTMSGTAHIVICLDIEFGKSIRVKDTCFEYCPDSSSLYSILNVTLFNVLVLRHTLNTVLEEKLAAHSCGPFLRVYSFF